MYHNSVLLTEVIKLLDPMPGQSFIDCTLGGGGHALEIAKRVAPDGKVLGIDMDEEAIRESRLKAQSSVPKANVVIVQDNFKNIKKIAVENGFESVDGILFDLGVSSHQLDGRERGFSFNSETLDMRMDKSQDLTAGDIINSWSKNELITIFRDYGEERLSAPIADAITKKRKADGAMGPKELSNVVAEVYKKFYKWPSLKNPATKIFQALRIAVNQELENLIKALPESLKVLKDGGIIAVISYHSLEDAQVKSFFKRESRDCICPPELPQCVCDHKASLKIITKKPITPGDGEIHTNPRSRSAKLRVAYKI